MKSILSGLILALTLISAFAFAQANPEETKIMSRLTTGAYSGPYHKGDEAKPLILIQDDQNFYKLESKTIEGINPDWIEKVEVLKGESAVDIFGKRGGNGVVLITLKEDDKDARKYFKTIKKIS